MIDRLKSLGEYENTVILLFGDHGDLISEDGMFGHSYSLADELIRVPLLVHDPTGQLESGRRTDVVQLNDLYPTILELAGETPPATNSVLIINSLREAAYVHLQKSQDELEFPVEEYPPFEQYSIWKSPSSKLSYVPESSTRDEKDPVLLNELKTHLEAMKPVPPPGETELTSTTRTQLENMGYL